MLGHLQLIWGLRSGPGPVYRCEWPLPLHGPVIMRITDDCLVSVWLLELFSMNFNNKWYRCPLSQGLWWDWISASCLIQCVHNGGGGGWGLMNFSGGWGWIVGEGCRVYIQNIGILDSFSLSCIVNTVATDDLRVQETRASAAMVLVWFGRKDYSYFSSRQLNTN